MTLMLKDTELNQGEEILDEEVQVMEESTVEASATTEEPEVEVAEDVDLDDEDKEDVAEINKMPADVVSRGTKSMALRIKKAVELQEVLYANVTKVQDLDYGKQVMTVALKTPELRGLQILIPRCDADLDFKTGDLFHLLGCEVPVVITGRTATKNLVGSRKMAQNILKDFHMDSISSGETIQATILSFGRSGAFLAADRKHGHVVGFLRDSEYSTDHMSISENKRVGDTIDVRCLSVQESGRIAWEAVNKVERTEPIVCLAEKGCSCEGVVKSITTFPSGERVFVTIQPGLDASCFYPSSFDVEVGDKVFLKVQDVTHEEGKMVPKVRAVIIKVR